MASSWDNNSDRGSDISRATSDITAEATGHAQQRMVERFYTLRDFQAAKKHGVKERHRDHVDRWVFKHNGSCFVTNETTEKLITVIPPRGLTAVVEIPTGDRNALAAELKDLVDAQGGQVPVKSVPKLYRERFERDLDYRGHGKLTVLLRRLPGIRLVDGTTPQASICRDVYPSPPAAASPAEIEQRDFQAAKKYGSKERHHTYADRWVFKHNGSVFVTNETSDILITCLRPRPAVAPEELHASVLRAIAPSIEAVVAESVAKALGARQPDALVCQLAPPPAPPRSVSPAARPRSVSRSRSPRPARSVPVMVFREDATVRPLRVVVTVPARSTLSSVKDALADLLNARDGVVFELRMTKKGGRLYSTSDWKEVEDIDYDNDLVAYELDAGLANARTVNVYMGAEMKSLGVFGPSNAVSYLRLGWPICMAFAAGATCGDVRRDVAARCARFVQGTDIGARLRIVSKDGMTGKRDLPADNDERLPADVQALVVAWTEGEAKELIDARELYAVDDHVSAHDYAYPNLVSM